MPSLTRDLGQLYLGVFSGPVEGILLIVGIFIVTGIYGMSFALRLQTWTDSRQDRLSGTLPPWSFSAFMMFPS